MIKLLLKLSAWLMTMIVYGFFISVPLYLISTLTIKIDFIDCFVISMNLFYIYELLVKSNGILNKIYKKIENNEY